MLEQRPITGSNATLDAAPEAGPQQQQGSQYYDVPIRAFVTMVASAALLIGVAGNALVVAVVLRVRSRLLTPTNCYLVSLAASDLLVLLLGSVTILVELNVVRDNWLLLGVPGCKLNVYLTYVAVKTSAFAITAFSIERYVAICRPMRAHALCTVRRAKRIICAIWLCGLAYNSPWLYLATLVPVRRLNDTVSACGHRLNRTDPGYAALYVGDLLLSYLAPLVLLSVLYTAVARVLFRSSAPSAESGQPMRPLRTFNTARSLRSRAQVVKMLFVVVYRIVSEWYRVISRLLVLVNSAINPVIYNAMSVKFRREFRSLLYWI
uniref:Thyrotropin-releasing hormone receptor n=1 Tax=Macrostomum lignano TaxID=282301 RepID=A0A1I8H2D1_9PLAT